MLQAGRASLVLMATTLLLAGCPDSGMDADPNTPDPNTPDAANQAPIPNAGASIAARSGDIVVLDGAASADPDGDPLVFFWQQVGGSPSVQLTGIGSSRPQFEAPAVSASTALIFELTVSDAARAASAQVLVTVSP